MKINDRVLSSIKEAFSSIGYKNNLMRKNYTYTDFLVPDSPSIRTIDLGIFGHEPLDYRSACFGIYCIKENDVYDKAINDLRSFGATQYFIVLNGKTERWANKEKTISRIDQFDTKNLISLIKKNEKYWNPDEIIRAKSGFQKPKAQQLDFIDTGLLPALEHEASQKIDLLIKDILNYTETEFKKKGLRFNASNVFRIVFRLLAAKLLYDSNIQTKANIDFSQPQSTLDAVLEYYGKISGLKSNVLPPKILKKISEKVGSTFSLRNLSVDTLTYIYENTFVSPATRKELGIHSTPSYIADYVLSQMPIEDIPRSRWDVLDPMCGHGIFLIAAMRRIRSLLPKNLGGHQRHKFFVKHLSGIEIDSFSVEVAKMCLMLADFPEKDSWNLKRHDIFKGRTLEQHMSKTMILIGNPPFEKIQNRTPEIPKPIELLRRCLPALPKGALIGLILPKSILDGNDYKKEREQLLENFTILSITTLPDRVFYYSDAETVVLIAKKQKKKIKENMVTYQEVKDSGREDFKLHFRTTWKDNVSQSYFVRRKNILLLPLMRELWERLETYDTLIDVAEIKTGVEYEPGISTGKLFRSEPFPDSRPGIVKITDTFRQFRATNIKYMATKKEVRRKMVPGAWNLNWDRPKVILPKSRMSRGIWKYAAAIDYKGLLVSRRFFSVWTKKDEIGIELIAAILNSPLAQAFVYSHSTQRDIPKRVYSLIPIPKNLQSVNTLIKALVKKYLKLEKQHKEEAKKVLLQIDAEILKLYELPPKLERKLLDIFWGQQRCVFCNFPGYIEPEIASWIPLHVYISEKFRKTTPEKILNNMPVIDDKEFIDYLKGIGTE